MLHCNCINILKNASVVIILYLSSAFAFLVLDLAINVQCEQLFQNQLRHKCRFKRLDGSSEVLEHGQCQLRRNLDLEVESIKEEK